VHILLQWAPALVGLFGVAWTIADRLVTRAKREGTVSTRLAQVEKALGEVKQSLASIDAASDISLGERSSFGERLRLVEEKARQNSKGREQFIAFQASSERDHAHLRDELRRLCDCIEALRSEFKGLVMQVWAPPNTIVPPRSAAG
jgi:hypothetical protein